MATVAKLDEEAYRRDSYGDMTLRQFRAIADDLFQVAVVDGQPVGYALALPTAEPGAVCFMSLVVQPTFRGQGIGRELVERVLANCEARGYRSVWLTVDATNLPAIKLYSNFQFTQTDRVPEYFGPERDRLVMERKLG